MAGSWPSSGCFGAIQGAKMAITASSNTTTAMGYDTTANGNYSTAMGYQTEASGANSTALGTGTTASGDYSVALCATAESAANVYHINSNEELAFGSFHEGGCHVLMADGSGRFVSENVSEIVWRAVGSRNGGETEQLD